MIAEFFQGGLVLPDRDYYLKDDDKSKATRAAYLAHLQKMFGSWATSPTAPNARRRPCWTSRRGWPRRRGPRVDLRDPHRELPPDERRRRGEGDARPILEAVLRGARPGRSEGADRRPAGLLQGGRPAGQGGAARATGRPTCAGTCSTPTPTSSAAVRQRGLPLQRHGADRHAEEAAALAARGGRPRTTCSARRWASSTSPRRSRPRPRPRPRPWSRTSGRRCASGWRRSTG